MGMFFCSFYFFHLRITRKRICCSSIKWFITLTFPTSLCSSQFSTTSVLWSLIRHLDIDRVHRDQVILILGNNTDEYQLNTSEIICTGLTANKGFCYQLRANVSVITDNSQLSDAEIIRISFIAWSSTKGIPTADVYDGICVCGNTWRFVAETTILSDK